MFFEPSLEAPAALVAPENQTLLASLPSYWFLGLFQQLNGSMEPAFIPLARRAWIALAISALGTVASILLSYLHTLRRIVEEPDILPSSRRSHGPPSITSSVDNAVLLFSLRTLLRSQQHRLILSLYLGVGFAVMLILLRPALGNGAATAGALLTVSILMLCVAAVAVRTVFSMPIMLRANWLFRVAALHPVATYSKAVRRSFLLLAVAPVWASFCSTPLLNLAMENRGCVPCSTRVSGIDPRRSMYAWFSQDSLQLLLPARQGEYTVRVLGISCAVAFRADGGEPCVGNAATSKRPGKHHRLALRTGDGSPVANKKSGEVGGRDAV